MTTIQCERCGNSISNEVASFVDVNQDGIQVLCRRCYEYRYRLDERLGILCGTKEPTVIEMKIATKEAEEAMNKLGTL